MKRCIVFSSTPKGHLVHEKRASCPVGIGQLIRKIRSVAGMSDFQWTDWPISLDNMPVFASGIQYSGCMRSNNTIDSV